MSKSINLLGVVSIMVFVSACDKNEEEIVYVDPEPISTEPVSTGKYK